MAAPPISERLKPHWLMQAPVKELVRAATTANVTISTALNAGDTIDGVTLAAGDRVLVKNQSTDSQNGIYVAGASPARAYDLSSADPHFGFLVVVLQGTANAGTMWRNTNTTTPTIGSTSITFAQVGVPSGAITASGLTMATARLLGRTTASTGAIEEITVGSGLTLSAGSLAATGSGAGTVNTADDGTTTVTDPDTISITGSGGIAVTVSESPSGTAAYDIDGSGVSGGSGVTVQYPSLKPATPTDDFDGVSLDAAWGVHSVGGSFAAGHIMTQGEDWLGSAVELQFSAQMGTMKRTQADTDFDVTIGGLRWKGNSPGSSLMFGIAFLNSSGTGVGVIVYDDGNCYFVGITTYNYGGSFSDSWTSHGHNVSRGDWWLRLKRISGTWTGYVSQSGRAWDKTFSTRADSITVAEFHVGLFYNTASTYSGRLTADYFQQDA